jgi:hypothetical protein
MLRGGDGVAARGVRDHNALLAGVGNIHVVQTGAGPTHHLQARRRIDQFRRHLGGAADGQCVRIFDLLFELFGTHARTGHHFNIGVLFKNGDPVLMQIIAD